MADTVVIKDSGQRFAPHPEGSYVMECCDVVDLGEKVDAYPGQPPRLTYKVALVFRSGEAADDGRFYDVSLEATASMNERATLRQFLDQWRGKSYTDEQARGGIPVHKLVGQLAYLTIEHKTSGSGRVYAKIRSTAPAPKGSKLDPMPAWERPAFWAERKAKYAEDAHKFRAGATNGHGTLDEVQDALDDADDDLPF